MYSIKTDLDVTGNQNVGKDLLVKGNAVFKNNVKVEGTVDFADAVFTKITTDSATITQLDVTGKASLSGGVEVKGDTVIGNTTAGSDTATINSNAVFKGAATFAGDITQTSGKAILQDTQLSKVDVRGESTFEGDITASAGTTATFDKVKANDGDFTTLTTTDISSTGTATFKDVTITGTLGGKFSLDDIKANSLSVSGLTALDGAVTLGSSITGANTTATFKDIKIGASAASQTYRLSFNYTDPTLRPTVILQNEVQSELVSPTKLNVLKTATFGNEAQSDFGITGKGLNKLDYLTVSGNTVQDPTTPLLDVTAGKSKFKDIEVTNEAIINNLTVNGTLGGNFKLDDIKANSLSVTGLTALDGAVTLGADVTGYKTAINVKAVRLGQNTADTNTKYSFVYSEPGQRPTVILQNEVQSELVSPAHLNVLKTATFGNESQTEYGITGKGLNKLDYLDISGNAIQDPSTPQLTVAGKSILKDVDVSGDASFVDLTSTGDAHFNNVVIDGSISGDFDFGNIKAGDLHVTGLTALDGAVTLGADVTGPNTNASIKSVSLGGDTSDSNVKIGFKYTAPGKRPTVILQNEVQSEKVSPVVLNVLKTATFGDETQTEYGITGKGLNKLDYLTISGNTIQDPTTPLLSVGGKALLTNVDISGKTTMVDVDSTGDATFNNVTVNGTFKGNFVLDDITVNTITVSSNSSLEGSVTLGSDITGISSTASFKEVKLGQNSADSNVKYGFEYTAPGKRPTVILQNEVQSEKVSPVTLEVQKTATFGDETQSEYGITGKGLNKLDYLKISGNTIQDPTTPMLEVSSGKTILHDVDFTGIVTGLTVDVSGQDLTPKSVIASEAIKGKTLESVESTTVGTDLSVGGQATITGNTVMSGTASISGELTAAKSSFSGDVTVTGQNTKVVDLNVSGTANVKGDASVEGNLDVTGTLKPGGIDLKTTDVDVKSLKVSESAIINGDLTVVGEVDLSSSDVKVKSLESTGIIVSTDATNASVLPVLSSTEATLAVAEIKSLTVEGTSTVGAVNASGDISSSTKVKAPIAEVATISNADGVSISNNTSITGDLNVSGTLKPGGIDLKTTDVDVKSLEVSESATINGDLTVVGAVDLSASDVKVKSLESAGIIVSTDATNASVLPVLESTEATIATADITKLTVTSTSTLSTVTASGDISSSTKVKAPIAEVATISNADGVSISNNTSITGNLHVGGTFTAVDIDLKTTDVGVKSLEVSESATINGDLTVVGAVDLTASDVKVKSLESDGTVVSKDVINASVLPVLESTEATIITLDSTTVNTTNVNATSGKFTGTGVSLTLTGGAIVGAGVDINGAMKSASITSDADYVSIEKSTNVTGDFHASGTLTAGSIDLSKTDVTVKSLTTEDGGDAHIKGDLIVDGDIDLSNAVIKSVSLESTGNTTVGADLILTTGVVTGSPTISGNTTVSGDLTAEKALNVTGKSTLGELSAGNTSLGATSVTSTLNVTGKLTGTDIETATLKTTGVANVQSLSSVADVDVGGNSSIIGNLTVGGDTEVQKLTVKGEFIPEGGLDLSGAEINAKSVSTSETINATGLSTLNGGVSTTTITASGAVDVDILTVTKASTFNDVVTIVGATSAADITSSGKVSSKTLTVSDTSTLADVTVTGTLTPTGGVDLSQSEVTAKKLEVSTTLDVTGKSTLGSLESADITTSGAAKVGSLTVDDTASIKTDATVGGTLKVTGEATVGSINTTGSFRSGNDFIVGVASGTHEETMLMFGDAYISGHLRVAGGINADIDVSGQTIEPFAVEASDHLYSKGNITAGKQLIAAGATIGETGSTNNNLTVNGNVVNNGNFTVTGKLIAALDQSTSNVDVKSLTSSAFVKVGTTLDVTGKTTLAAVTATTLSTSDKATLDSSSVTKDLTVGTTLKVTGKSTLGDLDAGVTTTGAITTGAATINGNTTVTGTFGVTGETTITGAATINGKVIAKGSMDIGTSATDALTVNATSTFKENVTFDKDVTINGKITADIADLATKSVITNKYAVNPSSITASIEGASGSWTPDGETNVYRVFLDKSDLVINPIKGLIGSGKALSVYLYLVQDATGSRNPTFDGTYSLIGGEINQTANSVTIVQLIYDGYSSVVDMFIAQRTA